MGGRGSSAEGFGKTMLRFNTGHRLGEPSPIITAGLMQLRGNEADTESTLRNIDKVRFNALSHEQLFVVDSQGFVLKGYNGKRSSVSFDVASALTWKGLTVTHRHPGSYGGTFSFADVENTVQFGFGNHEASANEGRYSLKPTREANGEGLLQALNQAKEQLTKKMIAQAKNVDRSQFETKQEYLHESRKKQLQVLHSWYAENMPKYGYQYTFTPRTEEIA